MPDIGVGTEIALKEASHSGDRPQPLSIVTGRGAGLRHHPDCGFWVGRLRKRGGRREWPSCAANNGASSFQSPVKKQHPTQPRIEREIFNSNEYDSICGLEGADIEAQGWPQRYATSKSPPRRPRRPIRGLRTSRQAGAHSAQCRFLCRKLEANVAPCPHREVSWKANNMGPRDRCRVAPARSLAQESVDAANQHTDAPKRTQ